MNPDEKHVERVAWAMWDADQACYAKPRAWAEAGKGESLAWRIAARASLAEFRKIQREEREAKPLLFVRLSEPGAFLTEEQMWERIDRAERPLTTHESSTCVYLRDGTKIVIRREGERAWLEHVEQETMRLASSVRPKRSALRAVADEVWAIAKTIQLGDLDEIARSLKDQATTLHAMAAAEEGKK